MHMLQHIPCSATFSIHEKKCFVGRRSFSCKHASHDMLHTVPLAPGGQPWCRGSPWSPGCRGMPAAGLFRPAMPTSKPAMAGLVQELGYQNRRFCYPSNILVVQVAGLDTQDRPRRAAMVAGVQGKAHGWLLQASHAPNQASHLVAGLAQEKAAQTPNALRLAALTVTASGFGRGVTPPHSQCVPALGACERPAVPHQRSISLRLLVHIGGGFHCTLLSIRLLALRRRILLAPWPCAPSVPRSSQEGGWTRFQI